MMTLQEAIQVVLESGDVAPFRRLDVPEVYKVLLDAAKQYEATVFLEEDSYVESDGPCFVCRQPLVYSPVAWHKKKGAVWFNKIKGAVFSVEPGTIECRTHGFCTRGDCIKGIVINGVTWASLKGYVCSVCESLLRAEADEHRKLEQELHEAKLMKLGVRYTQHQQRSSSRGGDYTQWLSSTSEKHLNYQTYKHTLGSYKPEVIQSMPYQEFLNSRYWRLARVPIWERDNLTCVRCGATRRDTRIDVHHKTYIHHGKEHLHPEDLECLCRECHVKYHDMEKSVVVEDDKL